MAHRRMKKPALIISELDSVRLQKLLDSEEWHHSEGAEALAAELDRAEIVDSHEIPKNVVSMNSRVRLFDEALNKEIILTLVYPQDAGKDGTISIMAPVGSALLGMKTGQEIDWPLPSGTTTRLKVLEILYQPEAAGEFLK